MAYTVLGHGGLPFVDAGEQGLGAESEDLLQLVADHGNDGVVGKRPEVFGVRSGKEATEQCAIFWRAARELVVDEGCGQQTLAFAARDEESEAGREGLADLAVVAEADSYGGCVVDGGKFGGELGAADRE